MLLSILSRNPELYSTSRLVETAKKKGHDILVEDPLKYTIHVENPPRLLYAGKALRRPNAVIPRIGASITHFGLAVVRQFEQLGIYTANNSNAIAASRDKLHALQLLSSKNVNLPATIFVRKKLEILRAIEDIGGAPVVIKLLEGTQGMGVVLAEELGTAQAIIELLQVAKQNILVQKFVAESKGRDIRVFVVGGKVVAAMRRKSKSPKEFRSNLHRGAESESIDLPKEFESIAVRAATTLGLDIAGVDLLEGKKGPVVIEVNSSPGLEGIEKASKTDIAASIIDYVAKASLAHAKAKS